MTGGQDIQTLAVKVGEISGQLREMYHAQNNMAQKVDFLTEKALLAPTTASLDELTKRIDALESERDRRDGATGLGAAILKSPAVGWLVGLAAAALAVVKGDVLR